MVESSAYIIFSNIKTSDHVRTEQHLYKRQRKKIQKQKQYSIIIGIIIINSFDRKTGLQKAQPTHKNSLSILKQTQIRNVSENICIFIA